MDDPVPRSRPSRALLVLILLVGLALRAVWGLSRPANDAAIDQLPDQREYLTLAANLLHGGGLHFADPRFHDVVYAFRTPGYPAFLAAFGAQARAARIGQAFVDMSTVLAAYLLALALLEGSIFQRRGPLLAAALVALNPFLIYFSSLLLSETLFTAMLAWGMLLLVVGGRGGRLRLDDDLARPARPALGTLLWLCGGLLLALSGLVRPSALPLPVLLGIAAVFLNRSEHRPYHRYSSVRAADGLSRRRWPLPVGTTMLLLTVLVVLPWGWRNHAVLGTWVWTTTNDGVTLADGFNPDATGASDQSFLRNMPQLRTMNEVERSQYLAAQAKQFIREHPQRALQLAVLKAARTWSPVPLSREYGDWTHRAVGLLYALPFDLLVLFGLFARGMRRSAKVFLLLPAIYFTVVHMASVGSLRYRIPVEAPLAILAAAGAASLVAERSDPPWKRAARGRDDVNRDDVNTDGVAGDGVTE